MPTDQRRECVRKTKRNVGSRFGNLKRIAKRRGLPFDLSLEHYTYLVSSGCYYCEKQTLGIETGGGLDRINNAKGYLIGNVLPCCGFCNIARGNSWTVGEFKLIRETMMQFRGEEVEERYAEQE